MLRDLPALYDGELDLEGPEAEGCVAGGRGNLLHLGTKTAGDPGPNSRMFAVSLAKVRRAVLRMAVFAGSLVGSAVLVAQQQPIEFPHNKHVAIGVDCIDCHITVDTRGAAGLPSVAKCMLCHEKVATEGPGVQKLREFAEKKREIPWVRIYQFNRAGHVNFQHAPHVRKGIECSTCHGDVAEMTVVTKQVRHTMGTCLDCHRQQKASEDCTACHY